MAFVAAKTEFRDFTRAVNEIQRRVGIPLRTVIRSEIGSVLKQVAGDVKVSTQEKADVRSRNKVTRGLGYSGGFGSRADHPITVNSGRRGPSGRVFLLKKDGSGFRRTHEQGFSPLNQHYKDVQWADLRDAVADVKAGWRNAIPAGRRAIGLARQSVIQMADAIGIRLETVKGKGASPAAIAKARAAIASDGTPYQNGTGSEVSQGAKYLATLIDSLPYGRKIGIDSAIARRINGRVAFFNENVKRGVFEDIDKTLRAYPGFRVTY